MESQDHGLVERCLQGDNNAWEAIVRSHTYPIFRLSYRYTNQKEEAEDLTQEVLIRVYQNLHTYRSDSGSFKNWMLSIGRNLIIDHYRQSRHVHVALGSEELERINIEDDRILSPFRAAEQAEASRLVRECLHRLSPDSKAVIVLRDLQGMAYQEIARTMRVPVGTIKSRIKRARAQLASALARHLFRRRMRLSVVRPRHAAERAEIGTGYRVPISVWSA